MLLEIQNVSKSFMKSKVLDDVTLNIAHGERIAMMGPNGAGKTTLVRAMLGFYHIDTGWIRINGYDPVKTRVKVLKNISFIPQLPPPVKLSIQELLTYVQKSSDVPSSAIYEESAKMDLDLARHIHKPFFKLSGGMKQKLLIAIALSKQSDLLIFDEPTANLDPKGREKFYDLLGGIDKACTTLFITHRLDEIEGLINRKIYMDLGRVAEDEKL